MAMVTKKWEGIKRWWRQASLTEKIGAGSVVALVAVGLVAVAVAVAVAIAVDRDDVKSSSSDNVRAHSSSGKIMEVGECQVWEHTPSITRKGMKPCF